MVLRLLKKQVFISADRVRGFLAPIEYCTGVGASGMILFAIPTDPGRRSRAWVPYL